MIAKLFPKTARKIENNLETVNISFLNENLELVLNKELCSGCGVCSRGCPKEAIMKRTLKEPVKIHQKQIIQKIKYFLIPNIHDPESCVYCGLCSYLCPFEALTLKVNGEIISPDNLPLAQGKAIPKLESEKITLDSGKTVKKYASGSVAINVDLCHGGCTNCAEVCPTGAISVVEKNVKPKNEWCEQITLEIVQEKCVYCGACHSGCPTGALTLKIDEIKYSGEYNSPFWDNVVDRLKLKERKKD